MNEFGGYFNAPYSVLRFFDLQGQQIGGDISLAATGGGMRWVGASSDVSIGSVEVVGGSSPSLDSLQANGDATPEPGTFALSGLAALALAGISRRRR